MNFRTLLVCMVVGVTSLGWGCCRPILYEPSADPSSQIMSLKVPDFIETLEGFPRTGRTYGTGDESRRHNVVVEGFDLVKEFQGQHPCETTFTFYIWSDEETARTFVKDTSSFERDVGNIFRENQAEGRSYWITYIERPRSDAAGFCLPMDFYTQKAVFRLQNLVIETRVRAEHRTSDMLSEPVAYLAGLLEKHFVDQQTAGVTKKRVQTTPGKRPAK